MTDEPKNLLDRELTWALAEEGMATVAEHTDEDWRFAAYAAVIRAADANPTRFTADNVWEELEEMGQPWVHNKSALGPVIVQVAKDGYIVNTGRFIRSIRPVTHGKALPVWSKK